MSNQFLLLTLLVAGLISGAGCTFSSPWSRSTTEKSVLDPSQQADVHLALGRTLERRQQWDAARTLYNEILRSNPQHSEAAHRLAITHDYLRDVEGSAKWFERALQLDPNNASIYCDLGYSLYRQGDLSTAEVNLRHALALDSKHRRARNHLGLVLAQTDRREEALAEFREAGCTTSEAHCNLAFAFAVQQQTERAATELQIASHTALDGPQDRRRLAAVGGLIARMAASEPAASPEVSLAAGPSDSYLKPPESAGSAATVASPSPLPFADITR